MAKVFQEHLQWTIGRLQPDGRPYPERWGFYCPGCEAGFRQKLGSGEWPEDYPFDAKALTIHMMNVRDVHKFNRNADAPTFEPSLLFLGSFGMVCHSFVRDGMIQYLGDCTHPLAGHTVQLPELS